MRKKKKQSKSILLPSDKRKALGLAKPKEEVSCPECGEKAERAANGKWRCVATEDLQIGPDKVIPISSCGARGLSLGKELITIAARKNEA